MIEEMSRIFMTKDSNEFAEFLKDKDSAVLLQNLLQVYVNDKNSSFLREMITCSVAGYQHSKAKLGYDGYLGDLHCEVKPQNVVIGETKRLNAGGCFNDFTWRKFKKCQEDNVRMLMSGFVNGKLVYILEFPFTDEKFLAHMKSNLEKHLPDGDVTNRYIRSCAWSLKHFENAKLRYLAENYRDYEKAMTKKMFQFLELGEQLEIKPINTGK